MAGSLRRQAGVLYLLAHSLVMSQAVLSYVQKHVLEVSVPVAHMARPAIVRAATA